jgi:serine-type D-Ala-D-Ala carboxypeptidase/endopeptidase (penicillin-binding protein 4)
MYRYPGFLLIIFVFSILFHSCKISKSIHSEKWDTLESNISTNKTFDNSFIGFMLFDLKNKREVINHNGNKYFTPASNTKLFTFYTSINILGDSIPALKYCIKGDSLIFWGTGNPYLVNYDLPADSTVINFLRERKEKLFYCDDNFTDQRYGDGWAWNDHIYYYQLDKSPMPVYGNMIHIEFTSDSTFVYPEILRDKITFVADSFINTRSFDKNDFVVGKFRSGDFLKVPLKTDSEVIISLLSALSGKSISKFYDKNFIVSPTSTLKQQTGDSIYIRLLHDSDNFIAEQLLLMCSSTLYDTMETKRAIEFSKQKLMTYLQDSCRWVDGSGLSRYNLFMPRSMISVLTQIYDKIGLERIKVLFPEIVLSESREEQQKYSDNGAGVYAKSGSLSNNYNLSGYIITNKSNIYLFSFMNNHFLGNNKMIRSEIINTLRYIISNY